MDAPAPTGPVRRGGLCRSDSRGEVQGGGRGGEAGIVADAGLAGERILVGRRADPEDQEPNRPGCGTAPAADMPLFPADMGAACGSVRGYAGNCSAQTAKRWPCRAVTSPTAGLRQPAARGTTVEST
ncbi:hypothetical protein [Streptomyces sp. NPDC005262]|uniref:hypothetical protein n=1 Tax=Streptomyces sp. NPDC005262 TaxID=3364710 RepID=UPI0036BC8021